MPTHDFHRVCSVLVSRLDAFRTAWLGAALELLDKALPSSGRSIVNRTFEKHRSVRELAEKTPADFPFNTVDGETVQSALIGFQSSAALQFALARKYIADTDFPEYISALLAVSTGNQPWLLSNAVFFGSSTLSVETLGNVLGRYFLNESSVTHSMSLAEKILVERLPFLGYFSQVGTAMAFLDQSTATRMLQQLNAVS